jgi:hypothetical protein
VEVSEIKRMQKGAKTGTDVESREREREREPKGKFEEEFKSSRFKKRAQEGLES